MQDGRPGRRPDFHCAAAMIADANAQAVVE